MSRNTHDRQLDHQGFDLEANVQLSQTIERYTAGMTLTAVLTDLIARIGAVENRTHIFSFTGNAVVFKTTSSSFTADAVKVSFVGSKTANSVIKKNQVNVFTIDAVKQ